MNKLDKGQIRGRGKSDGAVLAKELGVIKRMARALTLGCGYQRPRFYVLPDIQHSLENLPVLNCWFD